MRLFLALELSPEARESLIRLRSELESRCRGWRWVKPAGLHVTLRFLGKTDPDRLAAFVPAFARAAAGSGPIRFELAGLGMFPAASRPRVLWAGLREPAGEARIAALAGRLEAEVRDLGLPAETRPFRPHVTLARAARGARPTPPPEAARPAEARVTAHELVLFRSRLDPRGATHIAVDRLPLE